MRLREDEGYQQVKVSIEMAEQAHLEMTQVHHHPHYSHHHHHHLID